MDRSAAEAAKKRNGRAKRTAALIMIVILVAGAVSAYVFRDRANDVFRSVFGRQSDEITAESFIYEAGARQVYALAGNGLAVASANGVTLFDAKGKTAAKQNLSADNPALAASATRCAFFDIGGNTLRVIDFNGQITVMDTKNTIISVSMNNAGWMAVTCEWPGYKGHVTIYNAKSEPVYEWYSGSGYVIKAVVSPDCKEMAALCATARGGRIAVYALNDESEKSSFLSPDELLLDLCYVKNGLLCSVSERRAVFSNSSDGEAVSFEFDGLYLSGYDFDGDGFAAFVLSRYRSGNDMTLVTVDFNGTLIGKLEMQRDLLSLSANGNRLAALYSDGLELYSDELSLLAVSEDISGIRKALLRSKNEALLLSAYHAAPYSFTAS